MREIVEPQILVALEQPKHIGKWKAYEHYKDSGVEWLEKIPEHWKVRKLKYAAKFSGGGTPSKANIHYWSGDIPWVSPKDMKSEIVLDTEDHISQEALSENATNLIQPDAVLIVVRSGILKHTIPVAINQVPVTINQDIKALISRKFLLPKYLAGLINGHQGALLVEWRKSGATVESIEYELLINTRISIPPIREQQGIVAFLDRETAKINKLIAKKERMIELLQERRIAIINQAVTKGLNPDVPMKDSGVEWLGEIPAHWEVKKLKYTARFSGGGTPSKANIHYWSGDIPWVSPKDMKSEIILDTEDHISQEALSDSATNLIQPDAVLIVVRSGILRHTIPIAINQVPVTINQDIKAIIPHKFLLPKYLAALIHSHQDTLLVEWRKSGATVESIEYELLINTRISIPPLEEQQAILISIQQTIVPIDRLISRIQDGIKKLKEYSTALISAAVAGKIDVRGEVVAMSTEDAAI